MKVTVDRIDGEMAVLEVITATGAHSIDWPADGLPAGAGEGTKLELVERSLLEEARDTLESYNGFCGLIDQIDDALGREKEHP